MSSGIDTLITDVRRLDAAATQGPWFVKEERFGDRTARIWRGLVCGDTDGIDWTPADYEAVAKFRTAAPVLADEVERLRARVAELEAEANDLTTLDKKTLERLVDEQALRIAALEGGIVAENRRVVAEHNALRGRNAKLKLSLKKTRDAYAKFLQLAKARREGGEVEKLLAEIDELVEEQDP